MAYAHDIFISYRRDDETRNWIATHLVPLLELHVGMELGRRPKIFVDTQLESGAAWPAQLGAALGRSRVLLSLWSGNYCNSVWCMQELSHMLDRQKQAGLATAAKPHGLVIPAVIHDGDALPPELGYQQGFVIRDWFNTRMAATGDTAEKLAAKLKAEAPAIAKCVSVAPPWRAQWPHKAAAQFFKKFHRQLAPRQTRLPKFTG
jgi:hypothetical protein